jgi:hypothetical protein
MRLLLAWLAFICRAAAAALVSIGSTHSRLQGVQVTRASDAHTLGLTLGVSLERGVGVEVRLCRAGNPPHAHRAGDPRLRRPDARTHLSVGRVGPHRSLRHFGRVFCWELGVQLKRDVLPALTEVRVRARVRANPLPNPNVSNTNPEILFFRSST